MSGIVVTAIITPRDGQPVDKIEEFLAGHAAWVLENEPGTLRYRLHKSLGKGKTVFTMIETYKDKAALDAHAQSPKFKEMGAQLGSMVDMTILPSQPVAGFEDRAERGAKI